MNKTILTAVLLLSAAFAHATDNTVLPPREKSTPVTLTVTEDVSVVGITISSQTPTDIVVSTTAAWRSLTVYNLHASSQVNCGESASVSTVTTSAAIGHTVPAGAVYGNPWTFLVRPGVLFYCLGSHASSSIRISVLKSR